MIAVLHQRQHDIVAGNARNQRHGMFPRHVLVLHTLQDAHRTAGFNQTAKQKMIAPVLDELARDEIGLVRIVRTDAPICRSLQAAS